VNSQPEFERLVSEWLRADATSSGSDRVLASALNRTTALGQEHAGWQIGRRPTMNLLVPVGVTVVIVVLALAGLRVLVAPNVGGPAPAPAPEPDAVPPVTRPAGNGVVAFGLDGDIYVGNLETGEATAIVSGPETDSVPLFSPDGTQIAFLRGEGPLSPAASILVVRADGSDQRVVIPPGYDSHGLGFTWTPGGDAILVNHDFRGGLQASPVGTSGKLSLVAASGTEEPRILTPPLPYAPGGGYFGNVQVAPMFRPPNGDVVVSVRGGSLFLWDVERDIETPLVPTDLEVDHPAFAPWDFSWSPDGSMIAFAVGDRSEPQWEWLGTYLMNADGSDVRRLGRGGSHWSPDGTEIAYQDCRSHPEGDMSVIVIVDVETGAERALEGTTVFTKEEGTGRPSGYGEPGPDEAWCGWWWTETGRAWDYEGWSWAPDGESIVFLETHGEHPRMVDVQSGEVTDLPWIMDSPPSWQPVALD
jgi:Tol biopolymer transport system component